MPKRAGLPDSVRMRHDEHYVATLSTPAGLPIGIQFAARFGNEATLLRLAAQLEQARPWADRRPDLSAFQPA